MKVSVCIATYNGARYLKEQLQSILQQLGPSDEVIISDDSSMDETVLEIKRMSDPRIRLFEGGKFRSAIFNFEFALKQAIGDVLILSDQDDVWLPDRVQSVRNVFENSNVQLVLSNALVVDEDLNPLGGDMFSYYGSHMGVTGNIIRNTYAGCCMAFTRKALDLALPFPSRIPSHDQWIGVLSGIFFKVELDREPRLLHRRHGLNVSTTGAPSRFAFAKKLEFRIAISWLLLLRICRNLFQKRGTTRKVDN